MLLETQPHPSGPDLYGQTLPEGQAALIKTLLYFSIFSHPLTAQELYELHPLPDATPASVRSYLQQLFDLGLIEEKNGYWFTGPEQGRVQRRMSGSRLAEKQLRKAKPYIRLLSRFPFVRGIGLSGSISKGYMDAESDIDYFIITVPGRLWLCRIMLVLFRKVFLLNSHKYFCTNYFVAENNLVIPDKNLFTATELSHLVPVYNFTLYQNLMQANTWVRDYYPNFPMRGPKGVLPPPTGKGAEGFLERLLSGRAGEWLDVQSFRVTVWFWKRKFNHLSDADFDLNLRARKNSSKHHPRGFQYKVLQGLKAKISAFEALHGIKLD